jgi:hypothetical protein
MSFLCRSSISCDHKNFIGHELSYDNSSAFPATSQFLTDLVVAFQAFFLDKREASHMTIPAAEPVRQDKRAREEIAGSEGLSSVSPRGAVADASG